MKINKKIRLLKEALDAPDRRSALAQEAHRRKGMSIPDRRNQKRSKNPKNTDWE